MHKKDFYEKKRLIGNSSVLIIFDQNYSEKETISSLLSDMNFITFWIRKENDGLYSVKTLQSVDLKVMIKVGGIFDVKKLGRLMRFWVTKSADLAEAWKEEFTKADWDNESKKKQKVDFRKEFKNNIGYSLERIYRNQWRNIINRIN